MHWTGFAARRARSRAGLLVAAAAIVAVTSGSIAGILGAVGGGLDAGVAELLAAAPPTASALRVETRLNADFEEQFRQVEGPLTKAIGNAQLELSRSTRSIPVEAAVDGRPVTLLLGSEPALESRALLVAGEWPDAEAASGPAAVVRSTAAERLGLAPGDTITIGGRELRVSGTWEPSDASDPSWFSDEAVGSGFSAQAAGPVLLDGEAFARLVADLGLAAEVRWTIVPTSTAIGTAELAALSEAIPRLEATTSRLHNEGSAVTFRGGLADTVIRASRAGGAVSGVVAVPLLLIAVLGAIVLALVARALAGGRSGEEVLLRGRGLSGSGRTWLAIVESAVVAVLGSGVGVGVVIAVTPTVDPWTAWIVALAIAAVAVVILTVAVITRRPVDARSEDSGRGALVAGVGPLVLATVAAGIAAVQFFAGGSPVTVRPDGSVRVDALALAAPALLLVAFGLAARVAAAPVLALVERFAARGAGILPVLPARQLARRTRTVAAALLVVVLGAGVATYAAAFDATATTTDASRSTLAVGGGVRIELAPAGAAFPAPGSDTVASYTALDGVDSAVGLSRTVASIGKDAVWLLAADLDELRRLDPSYATIPTPATGAGDELPVVMTAQLGSRLGVASGDVVSVVVRGIRDPVNAVVAGIVPALPTTGRFGLLVAPSALAATAERLGGSAPGLNEVWLETDDPERAAAAARAVTTRPVEVLTRGGASDAAVLRVGTSLAWVGAIACLVLALIGFAAVAGALHRDRRAEGIALRSLGFGAGDQARSRGVELALTAASAILLGVGVGALAAWLTVPALAGGFALAVEAWLIALAALAVGLLGIGLLAASRVARDVARGGRE